MWSLEFRGMVTNAEVESIPGWFYRSDIRAFRTHVVGDLQATSRLLLPDGVGVLDDFRAEHTPGVAAAAWRCAGLQSFQLTSAKMFATWGDPGPWRLRCGGAQIIPERTPRGAAHCGRRGDPGRDHFAESQGTHP